MALPDRHDEDAEVQLPLDLAFRPAMGREDFLISESNAAAVAAVDDLPGAAASTLALVGPPGSGKTHLSEVWRTKTDALRCEAAALDDTTAEAMLHAGAGIIETMSDRGPSFDEAAFFQLLNAAIECRFSLLLTARRPPDQWSFATQDVASRLKLLPVAVLRPPDDTLFAALVMKLMADRQLMVAANALRYALPRIERSHATAERFVRLVEETAMRKRRPATLGVVREAVARLQSTEN